MKITHNKIGQNLDISSDSKTDKANKANKATVGSMLDTKSRSVSEATADSATRVDVSPRAQEARRIKELAMAAPDVNIDKVEHFRRLIDEGKYKVDAKAVADRLVDQELAMNMETE